MNARYWHEKDNSEVSLEARLKATGGMASPEIWNKLNQAAKVKLVEGLEATSACLRSGAAVGESIEAGKKTPHGATSVDSRPRGDVPSFVSSAQFHDLQDHGHKMTGGFESFLDAQAGTSMCLLKENVVSDLPCVPRVPVEADELPARAFHNPEVLERTRALKKKFDELKRHGHVRQSLPEFLEAHGVKVSKSNR